ncbi:MAG: hypothetical protein JO199_14130 [Candidatus Eremiobacteraeota bacterium]|nr:hypothetical protein [Candidatus Eremiobacteraeota bacterium]
MRVWLLVSAAAAVVAVVPSSAVRSVVATAASTLVEATPLLLAGAVVARLLGRHAGIVAYAGCGCGTGPSARSLPAAALAWIVFGPAVAIARVVAAGIAARIVSGSRCAHERAAPHVLGELMALIPSALLAGAATQVNAVVDLAHLPPYAQLAIGAGLGFASSPCGVGAVAVASSLHARSPLVAIGFLCVAGIADARALVRAPERSHAQTADGGAYFALAVAFALLATQRGGTLVNPALTPILLACAASAAVLAFVARTSRCTPDFLVPALVLTGLFSNAPPPEYRATETTLSDIFPGERITFTGTLVRRDGKAALVRYAIVCCRADAAPVAVRLAEMPAYPAGTWLRVDGTMTGARDDLRLNSKRVSAISPPGDPFVYR